MHADRAVQKGGSHRRNTCAGLSTVSSFPSWLSVTMSMKLIGQQLYHLLTQHCRQLPSTPHVDPEYFQRHIVEWIRGPKVNCRQQVINYFGAQSPYARRTFAALGLAQHLEAVTAESSQHVHLPALISTFKHPSKPSVILSQKVYRKVPLSWGTRYIRHQRDRSRRKVRIDRVDSSGGARSVFELQLTESSLNHNHLPFTLSLRIPFGY